MKLSSRSSSRIPSASRRAATARARSLLIGRAIGGSFYFLLHILGQGRIGVLNHGEAPARQADGLFPDIDDEDVVVTERAQATDEVVEVDRRQGDLLSHVAAHDAG